MRTIAPIARIARYAVSIAVSVVLSSTGTAGTCAASPESPAIADQCRAHLASRLRVPVANVSVVSAVPVQWPDASLGQPERGKMYAQVITSGWYIVVEARGERHAYTTSQRLVKYAGAEEVRAWSTLFLRPIDTEPNMNCDIYRAGLDGGNAVRVYSGVSAFAVGRGSTMLAVRRDSRSGHTLLALTGGAVLPFPATRLHSALAYGAIAIDDAGRRWAAFVRPRLGSGWTLAVGSVPLGRAGAVPPQIVELSGGGQPGRLRWVGGTLWASMRSGAAEIGYRVTAPVGGTPSMAQSAEGPLDDGPGLLLNKSETLMAVPGTSAGKPEARVVRRWFNGRETPVVTIPGLALEGYEMLAGARFCLLWGLKDGKSAAVVVDLKASRVHEAAAGFRGAPAVWPQPAGFTGLASLVGPQR